MQTLILKTTKNQENAILEYGQNLKDGGAIIAQVYFDGFAITILSPSETAEFAAILGKTRARKKNKCSSIAERYQQELKG